MESSASSNSRVDRPALESIGVTAGYADIGPRPDTVLQDVNVAVHPGELVAVIGPNGAGKSTLVRVLSGGLKPRTGQVLLLGTDVAQLSRADIATRLAVVQQASEVDHGFDVSQIVMMGRAPHQGAWKLPTAADQRAVAGALERAGIVHLAGRRMGALSGGERQLVAIARALAQAASVLILDEASAHLDIRHAVELYELALREVRDRRVACLAVMHDLNLAAAYADRVILVDDGRVQATGTVDEVMTYRRLRDVFGVDMYVGLNELDGTRYFVPRRTPG